MLRPPSILSLFFFNDTATTEIYTLSLHDALPICLFRSVFGKGKAHQEDWARKLREDLTTYPPPLGAPGKQRLTIYRSEEHTSELQSHLNLVCRLLLEKKKT